MSNNDLAFNDDYAGDAGFGNAFGRRERPQDAGRRASNDAFVLSLDRIQASEQVRKDFDEEHITQLAASIDKQGLINPLQVEWNAEGNHYRIISGECRFRAVKKLAWKEVTVTVAENMTRGQFIERQIAENVHRKNLNPIEEARGYHSLMELRACNAKDIAEELGLSPTRVQRSVRLLQLPEDIIADAEAGKINKSILHEAQKCNTEAEQRRLIEQWRETGNFTEVVTKASGKKKPATASKARGVKKQATINGISITAASHNKKTLAELADAARKFADQIEAASRSKAA